MENNKNKENKDFVMYFRPFMDALTDMAGENYTAYKLFQFLCKHMDGGNALVVSMNALSEIMQLSRQTISKAVKYLSDNGWVCVMKSGTSNVYVVNPEVAWTSYGNQKQYCKFRSNVLLTSSENAEFLKNPDATSHYKTVSQDFLKSVQSNEQSLEDKAEQLRSII